LVKAAKEKYARQVQDGYLTVLNFAMAGDDFGKFEFNLSEETLWSSIKPEVSTRLGRQSKKKTVVTRTLASIIKEYGVPYYCKVDAAGYEDICLDTLKDSSLLPEFISVESECIGENQILSDDEALVTLRKLFHLGYKRFKLVDQLTLSVLDLERKFYFDNSSFINSLVRWWNRAFVILHQKQYLKQFNYVFRPSASGPFGNYLDGEWVDFDRASKTLIRHRKDYFSRGGSSATRSFSFWCDWHAAK
jgi:hypothetical protein